MNEMSEIKWAGKPSRQGKELRMNIPKVLHCQIETGKRYVVTLVREVEMAGPAQLERLHSLTAGWKDEKLMEWLSDGWGVVALEDLTDEQAIEAIQVAEDFNEAPELTGLMR